MVKMVYNPNCYAKVSVKSKSAILSRKPTVAHRRADPIEAVRTIPIKRSYLDMKKIVLTGLCVVLMTASVYAETRYISDIMEVTMRTGAGTSHKILSMVPSGTRLKLIEPGEQWSRVTTDAGREGWVLNRFLTETPPNAVTLERLQLKYDRLSKRFENLKTGNDSDKDENKNLKLRVKDLEKQLADITGAHEQLKNESKDFFILKSKYEKATAELTQVTQLADELDEKLFSKNIYWFAAGAGVLIVGFIMGMSSRKKNGYSRL